MKCFLKNFEAFKTMRQLDVIASSLCIESADAQGSTVTVVGDDIPRSYNGAWLIIDGLLFLIEKLTPQEGRTLISLLSPIDAFKRPLVYSSGSSSIGQFITDVLTDNWIEQPDGVYALPYLKIENVDGSAFVQPTVDEDGLFILTDYIREVRRLYNVKLNFNVVGDSIQLRIEKVDRPSRKVLFDDGHSQLETAAYSKSGLAKLTVVQPVFTGETDEAGDKVYINTYTDWYLADDGSVSTTIPARRATGEWDVLTIRDKDDPQTKVLQTFAKNSASHKIEFWSDRQLNVFDNCTFYVHGEILNSYISYVGKRSTDKRYFYRSGELATTATEKLKGVSSS